jgi:hypothetical protein
MPACRICENTELADVLDLGMQAISGVFPKTRSEHVPTLPLRLVRCTGGKEACGLLQLAHAHCGLEPTVPIPSYDAEDRARGDAVAHERAGAILERFTQLNTAPAGSPRASRRHEYEELPIGPSRAVVMDSACDGGNLVITSKFLLSRQHHPLRFLTRLRDSLDDRDIAILEERYISHMIRTNSYDLIRHDHAAYYALKQIRWLTQQVGLKIVGLELNATNTSTALIALARRESHHEEPASVEAVLDDEARDGLHTVDPYRCFADRVFAGITLLRTFLDRAKDASKSICALGASRSGNVILQSCRVTQTDIDVVGEIQPTKIGTFTPGTVLPIVPEAEVLRRKPEFLIVLPWTLRGAFIVKSALSGSNLLFPLPHLELIHVRC